MGENKQFSFISLLQICKEKELMEKKPKKQADGKHTEGD